MRPVPSCLFPCTHIRGFPSRYSPCWSAPVQCTRFHFAPVPYSQATPVACIASPLLCAPNQASTALPVPAFPKRPDPIQFPTAIPWRCMAIPTHSLPCRCVLYGPYCPVLAVDIAVLAAPIDSITALPIRWFPCRCIELRLRAKPMRPILSETQPSVPCLCVPTRSTTAFPRPWPPLACPDVPSRPFQCNALQYGHFNPLCAVPFPNNRFRSRTASTIHSAGGQAHPLDANPLQPFRPYPFRTPPRLCDAIRSFTAAPSQAAPVSSYEFPSESFRYGHCKPLRAVPMDSLSCRSNGFPVATFPCRPIRYGRYLPHRSKPLRSNPIR